MTIAVDFDGTIVEHRYPEIGKELPFATQTLRMLIEQRHKLILWTVREGQLLEDAVEWCRKRGVEFYAINKDYPEEEEGKKTIAEAIDANYPPQTTKPLEDEKAQLIDLSETLFAEGLEQPQQPRERAASTSAEEVVITVEDETKEPEKEEHRPFGWIRRK